MNYPADAIEERKSLFLPAAGKGPIDASVWGRSKDPLHQ